MPEILRPNDGAAQFEQRIRELERRLAAMETSRSVQLSTVHGGRIDVLNDAGNKVAEIGANPEYDDRVAVRVFDPDTGTVTFVSGEVNVNSVDGVSTQEDVGIVVQAANGQDIISATRDQGILRPAFTFPWHPPDAIVVTGASFASVRQAEPAWWPSTALRVSVYVEAAAGTTGEIRLRIRANGGAIDQYTSAISIADGSAQYHYFRWDLVNGPGIGIGSSFVLDLEARRTSGAGNVWVDQPTLRSWNTYAQGADTDGIY